MESLLGFLSTFEFDARLLNFRIVRESFKQNQRFLVSHQLLFFAGDRERRREGVQLRRPRLSACRNFHQFRYLRPQGFEIGRFSFRIINRLFGKLCRRRIGLKHFELLLDRSRKTCSCIYEHVQRCAGESRRNQAKENNWPKHIAIISTRTSDAKHKPDTQKPWLTLWTRQRRSAF